MGVNWIFAPVADVNNNPDNPIINIRSFGENPARGVQLRQAYHHGRAFGPQESGAGDGQAFSRTRRHRRRTATWAWRAWTPIASASKRVELVPFRAAIAAGVDAVMTAHLAVPALEPENEPATVSSKIITGVLRDELGFHGLVVTDAMDMQGLAAMFDPAEAPCARSKRAPMCC